MRKVFENNIWHQYPFLRILMPFVPGILLQIFLQLHLNAILVLLAGFFLLGIAYQFLHFAYKYKLRLLQGFLLQSLFVAFGMLVFWKANPQNKASWYGHQIGPGSFLVASIDEPPLQKAKSIKAEAKVRFVTDSSGETKRVTGKILLYFSPTAKSSKLHYGDRILIQKKAIEIIGSKNPGAFNYQRYAAFQGFYHQIFLKDSDYVQVVGSNTSYLWVIIYNFREKVLELLNKYLPNDQKIVGVAEALLIGYKEHLDKDLVQAYSNTGVVHIIAISGLHLGLIYVSLVWVVERLRFLRNFPWLKVVVILGILWFFSLLTGAPASVLRSAVMFTCIVFGKYVFKETSIYNSLASSGFLLLCYNPYLLGDVGFQLSYMAVIGIVWLQPHIVKWIYFRPRKYKQAKNWPIWCIKQIWELTAVSLAAQTFTLPLTLMYFHQFPSYFLFTNLLAVPLSTIILYGELLLLSLAWLEPVANIIGSAIGGMINFLNKYILLFDELPFSKIDNIYSTKLSSLILFVSIVLVMWGLTKKTFKPAIWGLCCTILFSVLHLFYKTEMTKQSKMVVYNTSGLTAIDFFEQDKYFFVGDSVFMQEGLQQNFHLKPTRIYYQANNKADSLKNFYAKDNFIQYQDKKILLAQKGVYYPVLNPKIPVDVVVVSHNDNLQLKYLTQAIDPAIVVFDASNPVWKIEQWKKDCADLHLRCYSVSDSGAFVLNIP